MNREKERERESFRRKGTPKQGDNRSNRQLLRPPPLLLPGPWQDASQLTRPIRGQSCQERHRYKQEWRPLPVVGAAGRAQTQRQIVCAGWTLFMHRAGELWVCWRSSSALLPSLTNALGSLSLTAGFQAHRTLTPWPARRASCTRVCHRVHQGERCAGLLTCAECNAAARRTHAHLPNA